MKSIIVLISLFFGLSVHAENKGHRSQKVAIVEEIDSLYRSIFPAGFYGDYIRINYDSCEIAIGFRDSLVFNFDDTTTLRQYCSQKKYSFAAYHRLIELMRQNKFLLLHFEGPGDCYTCSTEIIAYRSPERTVALICIDPLNSCNPDNCYWKRDRREKRRKLSENVWRVKRKSKHD